MAGFAVRGKNGEIQIVIYSHCNDRDKAEDQKISLTVDGIGEKEVKIRHYRIDSEHSNPYAVIFLSELSAGYYSLKFVSECGNDAYYKYNKLLLLKERTQELKDEAMELLGL